MYRRLPPRPTTARVASRIATGALSLALASPPVLALGGCAAQGSGYPSLAPRAIENLSLAEPATSPPPPRVADPAAFARYAPAIARARAADEDFRESLARERSALTGGRGAETGSDRWAAAQVALSRIEAAREPVIKTLADLDAARDADPTQGDTGEQIAAAQAFDEVQQIDAAETAALATAWPDGTTL